MKNTHPESCCRDRMSEGVGGDVGALKPQQVGNNDRFTSPCSYNMDLTSCLLSKTQTQRHTKTPADSRREAFAAPRFLSEESSCECSGGGEEQRLRVRRHRLSRCLSDMLAVRPSAVAWSRRRTLTSPEVAQGLSEVAQGGS